MKERVVLFDLDGTLTDPAEGITRSIQHALARLGEPPRAREDLLVCIGPPLHDSFRDLLGTHESSRIDEAIRHYRERFSVTGLFENLVYGGIPEALHALKGAGLRLYLATSKPTVFARRILEHFQLSPHFDEIHGSELDGTRTHKGELLAHILQTEQLQDHSIVMVGDRRFDIEAARQNGVKSIGVTWGYGSREELSQAAPDFLCEAPSELSAVVLRAFE